MIGLKISDPDLEWVRLVNQQQDIAEYISKVSQINALFWITKIFCHNFWWNGWWCAVYVAQFRLSGQHLYFCGIIYSATIFQINSKTYRPYLYWLTIIASTTVGTTLADFVARSLGIGYVGGSSVLLGLSLFRWYKVEGSISPHTVNYPRAVVSIGSPLLFPKPWVRL